MMKEAELTEEERQLAALARHRKRQRKGYSPLTSPVKPRATFGIARAADVCNNPSSALDNVRRKRTGDEVDYKRPTCSKEQWDENGSIVGRSMVQGHGYRARVGRSVRKKGLDKILRHRAENRHLAALLATTTALVFE
ncbi:hypothetical protein B0H14DRAFT_3158819 [Mycena olivaceomarginata]|nr:hypothetical protein B0H14DRAFT_3158819 [Mycena olivaceomarginata]